MLRWILALPFFLLALPGCDTECVGPNCPDNEPDEPWTPGEVDDDDTVDDDDDTPVPDEPDPEIVAQRSCDATLRYRPPFAVTTVDIAGEFNGWTPAPMTGPDDDGYWTAPPTDFAGSPTVSSSSRAPESCTATARTLRPRSSREAAAISSTPQWCPSRISGRPSASRRSRRA